MPLRPTRAQSMPTVDAAVRRRIPILPVYWKKAPEVEIVLDGEQQFIHSYSTYDEITGNVKLRFEKDTCIDDFAITFQGQTNTWVDKIATTSPTMGRTTGRHTFIRVQQPIDQSHLPEFNRCIAGETYSIPFKFVVPDRILDFICTHRVDQDVVRDAHLQLPPSIGDAMLSGQGNTLMDDLAPNMAKISYTIRVGLLKASPNVRKPELVQEELGVRIVPAREEAPPLSIEHLPDRLADKYVLRKEKNVRKGILGIGKKQGRLTAESNQPPSLKLHHPSDNNAEPITTMTTVRLRYDPASADEEPPTLTSIANKLRIYTFYGAAPWTYFPAPEGYDIWSTLHSQYPESIDLSSRNLSNVQWTRHEALGGRGSSSAAAAASDAAPNATGRRPSKFTPMTQSSSMKRQGSYTTAPEPVRKASAVSLASTVSSKTSSTNESESQSSSHSEHSSTCNVAASSAKIKTTDLPPISPSESYRPILPFYTASILVPITLPSSPRRASVSEAVAPSSPRASNASTTAAAAFTATASTSNSILQTKPKTRSSTSHKPVTFLPTFHSCLISRIYSLEVSVHAQSAGSLTLRLPIQLSLPYTKSAPNATIANNVPQTLSSSSTAPSAVPAHTIGWFDPFSSNRPTLHEEPQQDNNDDFLPPPEHLTANDEAIARVLANHDLHAHYQYNHLQPVPEYHEDNSNPTTASHNNNTVPTPPPTQRRHTVAFINDHNPSNPSTTSNLLPQSPPPPPSNSTDELPPEYNSHTMFRRVAAARSNSASSSAFPSPNIHSRSANGTTSTPRNGNSDSNNNTNISGTGGNSGINANNANNNNEQTPSGIGGRMMMTMTRRRNSASAGAGAGASTSTNSRADAANARASALIGGNNAGGTATMNVKGHGRRRFSLLFI